MTSMHKVMRREKQRFARELEQHAKDVIKEKLDREQREQDFLDDELNYQDSLADDWEVAPPLKEKL
jgi:hypothetical protein